MLSFLFSLTKIQYVFYKTQALIKQAKNIDSGKDIADAKFSENIDKFIHNMV